MVAKKKDWAELLGGGSVAGSADTTTIAVPQDPPTTVLMHTIVGNPENPRDESDYTDDDPEFLELKRTMKEIGQLQPLAVLSRDAFSAAKPDLAGKVTEADWVVVTGNRRLAAARQLGWTRIDIKVQDRLGEGDGSKIDEAVIIENIHRKNIAPLREAEFLQRMVERHGSQDAVAARIGKSQMYVSHRLALLKLAPDVQEQVDAGEVKLKDVRPLTRQPHDQQRAAVAKMREEAAAPKPPRAKGQPVQNPVLKSAPDPTPPTPEPEVQNPVLNDTGEQAADGDVPKQREEASTPAPVVPPSVDSTPSPNAEWKLPPVGWEKLSDLLVEQLSELDRHRLTRKLERLMAAEFRGTDTPEASNA